MTKHQLTIQLKRLGKKKVKSIDYIIQTNPKDLRQLLQACIRAEVQRYNDRIKDNHVITFLTNEEITEQQAHGKIDFNEMKNNNPVSETEALGNAIQGY